MGFLESPLGSEHDTQSSEPIRLGLEYAAIDAFQLGFDTRIARKNPLDLFEMRQASLVVASRNGRFPGAPKLVDFTSAIVPVASCLPVMMPRAKPLDTCYGWVSSPSGRCSS